MGRTSRFQRTKLKNLKELYSVGDDIVVRDEDD